MLEAGQILDGKYRIGRVVGEGGMGAVYEAEHLRIGRRVAIKILHGYVGKNREHVERFQQEAQASARIGSPHIVDVLDFGELPDIGLFLVMEFLEGQTLDERLTERGSLPAEQVVPIALELLNGLASAHQAGIVHRDLKPENIFLLPNGPQDFVKIVDFGVSKFTLQTHPNRTRTGSVMGTPHYMAPEQATGQTQRIDHRTDLYAVGVILYHCVTGTLPFDGENVNEVLFKVALQPAKAAADVAPHVDRRFSDLIAKAMAHDPADRFHDAHEFALALEEWFVTVNHRETVPVPLPRGALESSPRFPYRYPGRPASAPRITPQPVMPLTPPNLPLARGLPPADVANMRPPLESTSSPWEATGRKALFSSSSFTHPHAARRPRRWLGAALITAAVVLSGVVWWVRRPAETRSVNAPASADGVAPRVTEPTAAPALSDPTVVVLPTSSGAPAADSNPPLATSLPRPRKMKAPAADSAVKTTAPALAPTVPATPSGIPPAGRKFRTNL